MHPDLAMLRIVDALPEDAVVVEEGILSARALPALYPFRDTKGYFGLGSGGIGFAMAGAVGIQLALGDRPVVAVIGDGSAMYSIQALWTAANAKLPITYVIAPTTAATASSRSDCGRFTASSVTSAWSSRTRRSTSRASPARWGVTALRITDPDEIAPAIAEIHPAQRADPARCRCRRRVRQRGALGLDAPVRNPCGRQGS